jgi:P4 family phage/plasmid primase-like protien
MQYIYYGKNLTPANYGLRTLADVYASVPRIKEICQTDEDIHVAMNVCDGSSSRKYIKTEYLWFDIDYVDKNNIDKITDIIVRETAIPKENFYINWSGHGLHYITKISTIFNISEFQLLQNKYRILLDIIREEFRLENIDSTVDMVFDTARTLRVPGTINQKHGEQSYILQKSNETETATPLAHIGVKEKKPTSSVSLPSTLVSGPVSMAPAATIPEDVEEEQVIFHGTPDTKFILHECLFLQKCASSPELVREPEWYAMISVTARLEDGAELTHKMSEGHPKYDARETERKITQALRGGGPRTCKNINSHFGECQKCPHFEKVRSPIALKSPQHIATLQTGFHMMASDGKLRPAYDDMVKYTVQKYSLKMLRASEDLLAYNNGRYEDVSENDLKSFARDNFRPSVGTKDTQEYFKRLVETSSIKTNSAVNDYPFLLNVNNGIVDLKSGELLPHSPDYLFKVKSDIDYDKNATAPRFEEWVKYIFENDENKINAVLDYMAYAISGVKLSNEKFLMFTGSGANGKSVLAKILQMLLSNYATTSKANSFMAYGKDVLVDSRLVIFEELPAATDKTFWEEIKDLTSGGEAVINRKFKHEFRHRCWSKFLFICNELPYGSDSNEGFYRRFIIIRFNRHFTDEQKVNGFENTFIDELPGILNILIKRIHALMAKNFHIELRGSVAIELEQYKVDKDYVKQYCYEQLTEVENSTPPSYYKNNREKTFKHINLADLYKEHFKTWADDSGIRTIISCNVFSKRLKATLPDNVYFDETSRRTYLKGLIPRVD